MGLAQAIEQARKHIDLGEIEAAEAITERLRKKGGGDAEVRFLEGCIRYKQGDYAAAAGLFRQVVKKSPDDINARVNLAVALIDAGSPTDAIAHLQKVIERRPEHGIAWYNLGNAYRVLERLADARAAYLRAIAAKPGYFPAHNNLGSVMNRLGLWKEAAGAYRKAVELNPAPESYINLLHLLKRHAPEQTHALLHEAVDRCNDPELYACAFPSSVNLCAWPLVERIRQPVIAYAQSDSIKPGVLQDLLLPLNACPQIGSDTLLAIHRNWARRSGKGKVVASMDATAAAVTGRLRVAYLSHDFNGHAVGLFMRHLLASHDRTRFEIVCYSTSGQKDDVTRAMERQVDVFADVSALDDVALAQRIRADGIHLLIDLGGHTLNTRVAVLRYRPAPVQMTYLGYPNTTGLAEVDYRITDGYAEAEGGTRYTEQLIKLPESFLCFGAFAERPRATEPPARTQGHVTFGSFNHTRKLTPQAVRLWSEILRQVPGSRLLIKASLAGEACVQANLYAAFAAQGIGRERVELRGFTETRDTHLDCYNEIDIALDTFPYNGTTTTCEALWMGVPVVTLAGKVHAQRVSYSILKNIGVEETIAETEAEYVAIAVGLGRDLEALTRLRARLPGAVRGSILCDPVRFTRQIEQLFLQVWEEKSRLLSPDATGTGPTQPGLWVDHIQHKPYVPNLLSSWLGYMEKKAGTAHWRRHQEAMDLYLEARTEDIAGRRMKLARAYCLLSGLQPEQAGLSVAQTFLRIAIELGEIEPSLVLLQGLIDRLIGQESIDLSEPFLPVLADYEQIACHGEPKWWLLASLLELRDRLLAGSTAYADDEAMQILELLRRLGYDTPYVDDRCRSIQARRASDTAAVRMDATEINEAREFETGSIPLAVSRPVRIPQERSVRILHNLGRSGGTLISRCLACMQDIVLLSEIHPKGSERFNPLAQAQGWFRLFDEPELRRMQSAGRLNFLQQLDLIEQRCHELGKHLVIRDWAHVDFHAVPFTSQACYELTTANVLEFSGLFHLTRMAVTRHPVDQWCSLSSLIFIRERLTLADFLYGYRRYAEQCSRFGFLRYEDFVAHPEDSMKSLCRSLELPYDGRFIHVWPDYDNITGDIGVGPVKREIKPARRRELTLTQLDRFVENADYQAALEMLGYNHPR